MLKYVFDAVTYVLVPAIMISMVIYALVLCSSSDIEEHRAAVSGALAGFILFVVYVISSAATKVPTPDFSPKHPMSLNVAGIIVGLIVGFLVSWVVAVVVPTRAVGVATLLLTASGSAGLYTYFFSIQLHQFLLYGALALAFGWLIRFVLIPIDDEDYARSRR